MNVLNPSEVLLIDDNPVIFADLRDICKDQHDIQLWYASNSLETFQMLIQKKIDVILLNEALHSISSIEFTKILNEMIPDVPIIFIQKNQLEKSPRLDDGIHGSVALPLQKEPVLATLRQVVRRDHTEVKESDLFERLSLSEFKLREKMLIMRTTLDILSHDTKNMFIKIFSILDELPVNESINQLNDYIHELYEGISEALGYIGAKKRITPLLNMLNSIKIGVEQIPLPTHPRIKMEFSSRKLFYIETTRLFKNVILNIVDNALKYSPPDTTVMLTLKRMFDTIQIQITDRGIGIPQAEKKRVFRRSYRSTLSTDIEGTGQGLWISYNIIKDEGGTISIEDNPAGGTVFVIEIPACKIASLEQGIFRLSQWYGLSSDVIEKKMKVMQTIIQLEFPKPDFDIDSVVFANLLDHLRNEKRLKEREKYLVKLRSYLNKNPDGKSVLIADDSLFVHYTIAPILVDHGFRIVDYAFNGEEAVTLFKILSPDIAIFDITMPVKSGIEAAKEICSHSGRVKILFLTALAAHEPVIADIQRLFENFRYKVMGKPINREILIENMLSLLGEK
ncbi:MAG: response regulator [Spirochaetales bacterium]|nr:response regulator [Spirochaetales bacterium]